MRRRLPVDDSSDKSEYTESNADGSVTSDTNLTDSETCSNEDGTQGEEVEDQAWLFADENHPP